MSFQLIAEESIKLEKFLDLAKELKKKVGSMIMTVILIIVGILGTTLKNLVKRDLIELEIFGRIETVKTTVRERLPRIIRRVLEN